MNTFYYTIFGLLTLFTASHQAEPNAVSVLEEEFCGHNHAQQLLMEQHPTFAEQTQNLEEDAYRFFDKEFTGGLRDLEILPVVFHIIHDNGTENISDALVLQGLADLNAAFANEGYYDQGTGANTELQFCLAERDPNGNATTGINRVTSALTNMTLENDDLPLKDLIRWNPQDYINIWLVAEVCSDFQGCDINGYAYFPSAHGTPEDGVVIEAQWVGSNSANSSLLIHQMGHYLGLFHTFEGGCTNDDCLANGDRICDTPPDQSTVFSPCDDAPNTCTTDVNAGDPNNPFATDQNDMIVNYMDFSNPNCYSAFTQGQADRMHFFAEGVRSSLLESSACLPPCSNPMTASFDASSITVSAGGTVNFNNTSTNATTADWLIDDVSFSTNTNASFTFNDLGTFIITLEVGNADPNCSDEFSLEIEVVCNVQSAFTASAETVELNDPVDFTNSSTGATTYNWLIDGISQSANFNYNNAFTTPGLYDVCLIASTNFCADTSCLTITVTDFAGDCNATFIKAYGNDVLDENAYAITQSNDGNFYVGGSKEDSVLIIKIDDTGNLLWQKSFLFSTNGNNILGDLVVDSEGYIVGCGMGNNNANDRNGFVFRYDPDTDLIDWVQNHDHPTLNVNNLSISEISTGGDFLVTGQSNNNPAPGLGCDGYLFQINRLTGAMTPLNENYNLGSCETFQTAQIYNGSLYVGGRYNFAGGGSNRMRSATTRLDLNGNEIWTRLYLVDVAATAHLYLVDLLVEDDFIIQAHHGDIDGTATNNSEVYLSKTDLDGAIDWAKSYSLSATNDNIVFLEIVSTPDGYALLGMNTSENQIFVLKTDKDGNELWARSYGSTIELLAGFSDNNRYSGVEMIYADDYFYIAAHSDEVSGNDDDIVILKIDNNGLINSSCDFIQTLEVTVAEFLNPYDGLHPLTAYATDINGIISNNSPTNTTLEEEILCIAGCIEICNN
ncbi:MAG: M43 family zinc metalloprotease [Saprospiraceae bacterium]